VGGGTPRCGGTNGLRYRPSPLLSSSLLAPYYYSAFDAALLSHGGPGMAGRAWCSASGGCRLQEKRQAGEQESIRRGVVAPVSLRDGSPWPLTAAARANRATPSTFTCLPPPLSLLYPLSLFAANRVACRFMQVAAATAPGHLRLFCGLYQRLRGLPPPTTSHG